MRGKQVDGIRVHHNTDMKTLLRDKCRKTSVFSV